MVSVGGRFPKYRLTIMYLSQRVILRTMNYDDYNSWISRKQGTRLFLLRSEYVEIWSNVLFEYRIEQEPYRKDFIFLFF